MSGRSLWPPEPCSSCGGAASVHPERINAVKASIPASPTRKAESTMRAEEVGHAVSALLCPEIDALFRRRQAPVEEYLERLNERNVQLEQHVKNILEGMVADRHQLVSGGEAADTLERLAAQQLAYQHEQEHSARSARKFEDGVDGMLDRQITNAATAGSTETDGKRLTRLTTSMHEEDDLHRRRASELAKPSDDLTAQVAKGSRLHRLVTNFYFELFFATAILTNALLLGVQVEYAVNNPASDTPVGFQVLSYIYSCAFLVELVLRVASDGKLFFCSVEQGLWGWLDLIIVTTSIFEVGVDVAEMVAGPSASTSADEKEGTTARITRLISITRLIRVVRIIRIVRFVRPLRTLVYSIACTLKSLVWALLLLGMIIYVFGILFTQATSQFLTEEDLIEVEEEDIEQLEQYWGTLPRAMFTLFKSITGGDDWGSVAAPLSTVGWFWVLLFNCFLAFSFFAVLNVMTGVFCQSAIESAQSDQDTLIQDHMASKRMFDKRVEALFRCIDTDSSDSITINEFEEFFSHESNYAHFASLGIDFNHETTWKLFKLFDTDHDYKISLTEFQDGCSRMTGAFKGIDAAKSAEEHRWMLEKLFTSVERLGEQLEAQQNCMTDWIPATRSSKARISKC